MYKTLGDVLRNITIVESLSDSTLDMDTMDLDSINTTFTSAAMNTLLRNEVTPWRTSTPTYVEPKISAQTTALKKKKKLKLSGNTVRDKLMAMRDSDVSSLDTETDAQWEVLMLVDSEAMVRVSGAAETVDYSG